MKTKQKISVFIIVIVFTIIVFSIVWYFTPRNFLNGVGSSDVKSITVFDGNTGTGFNISHTDEISYIVENIQGSKMTRGNVSIGYSGYGFRVCFYDAEGKEIESFIINSVSTIRKDPFFYRCNGDLCFDYLKELENKYSN